MDTLLTLLFMGILYIGSKMWERFLSKINKNPEAHGSGLPAANHGSFQQEKVSKYVASEPELPVAAAVAEEKNITTMEEEQAAWRGKLDQKMIVNGVIFAEILQPPRAYRPFVRR